MGRRYCVNISKEMVASSKSVSSTVDIQSGAFMPVSVGPKGLLLLKGSGPMVVGSTQHYLVKDRHSMHVWRSPQDFRSKQTSGQTCVWKLS